MASLAFRMSTVIVLSAFAVWPVSTQGQFEGLCVAFLLRGRKKATGRTRSEKLNLEKSR